MDSGCDQAYEPAALLLGIPSGRKPADRTSSAPAQHAEVLLRFYSSLAPVDISPKFFRWEIPETLSADLGAKSDYLDSGRTRSLQDLGNLLKTRK